MYGRVMLVGPAGVGKSCFKRGLMGQRFDKRMNSTIVADVQSVTPAEQAFSGRQRPIDREWCTPDTTESWCEVTEEDEIQEIAQLLVLVGQTDSSTTSSSHSSDETTRTMFESLNEESSQILKKAFVKARELKAMNIAKLKPRPFFHLWDCGGQPVFLELLPIFLTSRTIFLLFFNAAIDLKQPWESSYRTDGKEVVSQGKVNMSTLEMMQRWIALIYSHLLKKEDQSSGASADPGYPRVITIGTRGDKLRERAEQVLREVKDSIKGKPALDHVLKQPVIIDNTTSGTGDKEDPGYKRVRKEISDITQLKLKKDTPLSWILFRKLLQLFPQTSRNSINIISVNDVHDIASLAKVQSSDVEAVLCFYHELGVLLYYPNIKGLKQKVILNPQWFVECLGKVLALPGATEERDAEDESDWELFHTKGILVQRLYARVWRECQGVQPEEFMELLTHFQLAVEVKVDTRVYFNEHSKKYFVPSVLPYYSSDNDQEDLSVTQFAFSSAVNVGKISIIKAAPLHVTFHAGFVVPGFFTRLATALLKDRGESYPIKLRLYFEKDKNSIFHNLITYEMQSLPSYYVVLTEHASTIEISFTCPSIGQSYKKIQTCCVNLKVCKLIRSIPT